MQGCVIALVAIFAVIAFVVAIQASNRASKALTELAELRRRLDRLAAKETAAPRPVVPQPEPIAPPVIVAPPPEPEPVVVAAPQPEPIAAFEVEPEPVVPPPTPHPPRPTPPPRKPFDWESLIGVKLFSWIAGIALVLAALFFLSYSVEHGWLSPPVRASLGLATGIILLLVCELRVARGYAFTANAMDGAGIAILYATLFAMHALWHLLPASAVFVLMLIVTAIAVLLSIRRDSVFIALLGLVGGFATPALLSTGENKPVALFSYLLLLNVGLLFVAIQRRWPLLTALSVVFTVIYEWSWIGKYFTAAQLPLAVAIFVLLAAAAAASLWMRRRADEAQRRFDFAAISSAGLPLLFAIYVAAVSSYGVQYNILFTFLLFITTGLSVIAIFRGPIWLHLLGGATIALVLVVWRATSYTSAAWPAVLAWIAAFVVIQLALSHFTSIPKTIVAPAFLLLFPALAILPIPAANPLLLFGTLFLLVAIIAAYAIRHSAGAGYAIAAFLSIVAEGVWSADNVKPATLTSALVIYAAFALLFLAVPIVARRFGRDIVSQRTMMALVLGSIGVLFFLTIGDAAPHALWILAIVLAIINIGAIAQSKRRQHVILAASAIILSWIVITVWCSTALNAASLVEALIVIGGFALLAVSGGVFIARGEGDTTTTYLGLIGHLFLFAIAVQPQLAFPPWPLFAVMFVLDIALGIAAIYLRRAHLMTAAMAASQLVLMAWAAQANATPWPVTAFIAAVSVCAIALIWFRIDRRFNVAAIVALALGDIVLMIAGGVASTPIFGSLLAAHLVIGIALLAVAWIMELHDLAILAVALLALGTALSRTHTPAQQLIFAGAVYAIFVAYPLLLGTRAKRFLQPYLAAVLAGVPFFVFARRAIEDAGYGYAIGFLPVFQAALMLLLVWRLLRIEAENERLLSRLALTAAAALAFITIAIPLQLEKQWITIGWAIEGAALVWLYRRIPHRGLLAWSGALLGAAFVRLALNPAVLSYHPASHHAIVNWYLYTYLVSAAAFFTAAWLLPEKDAAELNAARPMANGGGAILLFLLVNIEIADFYSTGPTLTFNFLSSSLAQDLTYTIGWALFAVAMLIAGLVLHSRASRVAAIVLLLVTVLKCFLHDLARLGGLYRVASLLGLTISLLLVGVLLQKFVIRKAATPVEEAS
ncbi:MAG TPA: DUF2339 domain-containing protein [Thermoanaerobaculia bacterium]|jgi:uncharacterized membrane protein|nr:DUF2339 domain-containing protein [Thermoanaerobaculia bacterium]